MHIALQNSVDFETIALVCLSLASYHVCNLGQVCFSLLMSKMGMTRVSSFQDCCEILLGFLNCLTHAELALNVNCYSYYDSVQFSCSVMSDSFCNPMDCSTPGLPVHQQLLEPTQTHVHGVSDAIRPSHPLSSPSPPALNLSQHQHLFK